ncbi:recombinase family protein [Rufibacter immobilis]|uniref:recombinase family protein n=1 Tax=Rufibacter immobilis TaxID=1348778 RepID=UPI0035E765AC
MKAIIYTRVSTMGQATERQVKDLQDTGYQVMKVFSEKVSGFSKSITARQELQKALAYMEKEGIKCLLIHEISRLGRNTTEVLNLLRDLENKGVSVYIHNLGVTLSAESDSNLVFTKLVITIMADLARMESEQLSLRIKSGIRNRKASGLHTGRKVNSIESKERFLGKHREVIKYLKLGRSYSEITKLTGAAPYTISKVKKALAEE